MVVLQYRLTQRLLVQVESARLLGCVLRRLSSYLLCVVLLEIETLLAIAANAFFQMHFIKIILDTINEVIYMTFE